MYSVSFDKVSDLILREEGSQSVTMYLVRALILS